MRTPKENTKLLLEMVSNEYQWSLIIKESPKFFRPPIFAAIREMKTHIISEDFNFNTLKKIAKHHFDTNASSFDNRTSVQQFLKAIIDAPTLDELNNWIDNFNKNGNQTFPDYKWNNFKESIIDTNVRSILEHMEQNALNKEEAEGLADYLLNR